MAGSVKGSAVGVSPYEALIREGLALEAKVGRAAAAEVRAREAKRVACWALGDWLVANTVVLGREECGRAAHAKPAGLTCTEFSRRSKLSAPVLSNYRKAAAAFPREARGVASMDLCVKLLREFDGDAAAALLALPARVAAAADGWRGNTEKMRLAGVVSGVERAEPRSFADAAEFLTAAARFAEKAGKVLADLDPTDAEYETLAERVQRIDVALAGIEVERPKRRRFRWLKAA